VDGMGAHTGQDGYALWKRWEPLADGMGASIGNNRCSYWMVWVPTVDFYGCLQWKNPVVFAANRLVSCDGRPVAYVVYVMFNVFVCSTGRMGFGGFC
jgi:hypothetical protein